MKKTSAGFSLVEILISLVVLSLLLTASYLFIPAQIEKARDARRKADLLRIRNALEQYFDLAEVFPTEFPDCGQPLFLNDTLILDAIPCDPVTALPYYYQTKNNDGSFFRIYANLENTSDISIDLVRCRGGCGPDCLYNYGLSSTNTNISQCSFVCAPGGGKLGSCEQYNNPGISDCPKLYLNDPTCNLECMNVANRCKNASGKNVRW